MSSYFAPPAGLPSPSVPITSKVIVRDTYAIIPSTSIMDSVCSRLPGWRQARCWILAAPAIGADTGFAQYLVYLELGGGCEQPEIEQGVESFLFVLEGTIRLTMDDGHRSLGPGDFAFVSADTAWSLDNTGGPTAKFIWVRKAFEPNGELRPRTFVGRESEVPPIISKASSRKWTTHLIPTDDLSYDLNMNIVTFGPGTNIPFVESHVMEHGLYMLEGRGIYLLNEQWHEVEAGDFIWMRAFCPQAFQASGETPARYLLYKNVNRQVRLRAGK